MKPDLVIIDDIGLKALPKQSGNCGSRTLAKSLSE
jgi:hypothetical protein